jgi:hypothetical protein
MMKTVSSSKTSVSLYKTTRSTILEDCDLHLLYGYVDIDLSKRKLLHAFMLLICTLHDVCTYQTTDRIKNSDRLGEYIS